MNEMKQDIIIKFCIVGEPAVGKTSMLCQYIHKKFDEKVRPTIGCDFSTKLKSSADKSPVRLQLWDIAGQERFNAVSKMYLRGALGCVIVCSAVQKGTLEQTLKWKKIIQQNSDFGNETNIPCILVQNKSDLINPELRQQYQEKAFLDNFAKNNGFCGVVQCSAKDNSNIEEVFQLLLDETFNRNLVKGKSSAATTSQTKQTKGQTIKLTANNQNPINSSSGKKKKCC